MSSIQILWVDDEIELLKPHILFLEKKDYKVTTCTNGADAIDLVAEQNFDIVFLDENMPGLTGLETLSEIKQKQANLPVVMITKSEEEYIMEEAIGSKIADYLIKPVNPSQILLSLKKNLDNSRLVSEKTTSSYQQEFRKISMDLAMVNSYEDWIDLYNVESGNEYRSGYAKITGIKSPLPLRVSIGSSFSLVYNVFDNGQTVTFDNDDTTQSSFDEYTNPNNRFQPGLGFNITNEFIIEVSYKDHRTNLKKFIYP